jgi:hypothetical protein
MAVVGEASIIVRAITTGVKSDIKRAFDGADKVGERAGADAGESFSRGFRNSSSGDVAYLFGKSLSQKDVDRFTSAREKFLSLARAGFTLAPAITAVGGAIGAVVGGLGVLVSIAAAATPALLGLSGAFLAVAASAAVLRAVFGGVGEAISAGAKVTAGAGANADALKAAEDRVNDAYYNLNETLKENKKRKEDAADAAEDAARAEADASIAVERAERSYRSAVSNTQKALENVTKAREDAREAIQQLRFELEGGVISEKKARLEFEKARESLQRVQDLPPNSRARREAELAFSEADLNLRRAIDKNNDLRKSTAKANREGVDGNERVVAANENLVAAKEAENDANIEAARSVLNLIDATKELVKAREYAKKGGEADIQSARAAELAYRELANAKKALENVGTGGTNAFQVALDKLSPAAQDFVKYILSLKEAFEELRKKLQEAFFPKFTEAVKLLVETYLPLLEEDLINIAAKLGELALLFATAFTTPKKVEEIKIIFESFTPIIDALGRAFIDLASAFTTLTAAFAPYTIEFAEFLATKAAALKTTIELKEATGELNEIFITATEIVRKLGEGFGNAFSAFGTIISATVEPGGAADIFLKWFVDTTAAWESTTKALNEEGKLAPFLANLTIAATEILDLIGLITIGFLQVAASPGFLSLIKSLQEVTKNFNDVGVELGKEGGALTAIGEFLVQFSIFVKIITESESIVIFFRTLTVILKGLNAVLGTEFGQAVLAFTGAALAISAAINLTSKAFGFYGDSLKGAILGTVSFIDTGLKPLGIWSNPAAAAVAKLKQEVAFLTYGLSFVSTPFLAIAASVAVFVAIFALAYTQSESLRTAVSGLAKVLGEVFNTALKDIQETLKKVFGEGTTLQTIFKGIGDFLSVTLIPILGAVGGALIGTLGGSIQGVIKLVGGILDIFDFVFNGVEALIGVFVGVFTGNWDMALKGLKDGVKSFQSFFGNILGAILAPFRGLINGILSAWNGMAKNFKVTIPKWVPLIGGKVFGFPTVPLIPNLAEGGIIMPSVGGTIARIGEAGRPERVEPLDPDGLSKRDRAMINMLAGPAGGINITVNPSAGMDERELAALVSRQLAFQMRKGAA